MKNRSLPKILLLLLSLIIIIFAALLAWHQIKLRFEWRKYPPIGQMVEVNGHDMHVYAEGQGDETLVFLSGSATAAPALDFKDLYSRLSDNYCIAVVERAGYGFSESADVPRDIDTVVDETREALRKSGETGPYVIFAHSLSGIEALRWAQNYPEEVRAIVGLDAAVPALYLDWGEEVLTGAADTLAKQSFRYRMGWGRLQPEIYEDDPAMTGNALSATEKEMYKAVVIRSYMTTNMAEEARSAYANAKVVAQSGIPVVPVYYFISDETEVGPGWRNTVTTYLERFEHGQYSYLDCGHYVHDAMPEQIAGESSRFIAALP